MFRSVFYIFLGVLLAPFLWLFAKLGWMKQAAPLPNEIDQLSRHFWSQGLHAGVTMQDVRLNHADHLAYFQFGLNPAQMKVVSVAVSPSVEAAEALEQEIRNAPQYTGVRRNARLVMGCTFQPADADLEARVGEAFSAFGKNAI